MEFEYMQIYLQKLQNKISRLHGKQYIGIFSQIQSPNLEFSQQTIEKENEN